MTALSVTPRLSGRSEAVSRYGLARISGTAAIAAARAASSRTSRSRRFGAVLDALEQRRALEGEAQLVAVEDVEEDDVVVARAQAAQEAHGFGAGLEQVGEEHDERATAGEVGDVVDGAREVGGAAGRERF